MIVSCDFHGTGLHFRAKCAKDLFSTIFALKEDYVMKMFRANKKKLKEVLLFSTVTLKFDQWNRFFLRLTIMTLQILSLKPEGLEKNF